MSILHRLGILGNLSSLKTVILLYLKCSPFITHLVITQIRILHGNVVASIFSMEFYKEIIGK